MAEDLASRLRSRNWAEVEAAVFDAGEHPDGDRLLADYVLSAVGPERLLAIAVLGDLDCRNGTTALRRLAQSTGPGSRDLRCASLLALAKRCGEEVSEELMQALADRDGAVKDYAVIALPAQVTAELGTSCSLGCKCFSVAPHGHVGRQRC